MLAENLRGGHIFTSQRYEESSILKASVSDTEKGKDSYFENMERRHIIDIGIHLFIIVFVIFKYLFQR